MAKKLSGAKNLFLCIAELIIGVVLLIKPAGFTAAIIGVMGVLLIFQGICDVIAYGKNPPQIAAKSHGLAKGLTTISFGVFCIFKTNWFLAAFPLLTAFYGALILVISFHKIQWTVDMRRMKQKHWYMALLSAAVSLVLSIVILSNPFSATETLWLFMGTMMIAEAVIDGLGYYYRRKK